VPAAISVLQHRAATEAQRINEQLAAALTSRIVIEQAKGVISERTGLDLAEAYVRLRQYARDYGRRLTDVAQAAVEGTVDPSDWARPPSRSRLALALVERLELGQSLLHVGAPRFGEAIYELLAHGFELRNDAEHPPGLLHFGPTRNRGEFVTPPGVWLTVVAKFVRSRTHVIPCELAGRLGDDDPHTSLPRVIAAPIGTDKCRADDT